MTNLNVNTNTFASTEEMNDFIVSEVQKAAMKNALNTYHNASDIESYLMAYVWAKVSNNPRYQTKKGVRQYIKKRLLDYFKSPIQNQKDVSTFSALSSNDDEGNESDFEGIYNSPNQVDLESSVIEGSLINGFMSSLSDRHRLIIELRAGILTSLSHAEMSIAKEIMDKQSAKEFGEVYLSNSDIAKIVGISRVNVQKNLDRISEKALDFGLEPTNW